MHRYMFNWIDSGMCIVFNDSADPNGKLLVKALSKTMQFQNFLQTAQKDVLNTPTEELKTVAELRPTLTDKETRRFMKRMKKLQKVARREQKREEARREAEAGGSEAMAADVDAHSN